MEPCLECAAELHFLCHNMQQIEGSNYYQCCCWDIVEAPAAVEHTAYKEGADLKDVLSTGRKRAAEAKPLEEGTICEWAGLKYAGGGVVPIIGCPGNKLTKNRGQYARHHGPDKNVLNNDLKNLHLICPTCHNRWHTLNDPYYGDGTGASRPPAGEEWLPDMPWQAHDPDTKATEMEIFENETEWRLKQ